LRRLFQHLGVMALVDDVFKVHSDSMTTQVYVKDNGGPRGAQKGHTTP
jgi:predicted hotdog family 3-hydroxylacyl-ACP dehydratase